MTYYENIVEIKTPIRSQSILINRYEIAEQLPVISKKNMMSLVDIHNIRRQSLRQAANHTSIQLPQKRRINMRIKRVRM